MSLATNSGLSFLVWLPQIWRMHTWCLSIWVNCLVNSFQLVWEYLFFDVWCSSSAWCKFIQLIQLNGVNTSDEPLQWNKIHVTCVQHLRISRPSDFGHAYLCVPWHTLLYLVMPISTWGALWLGFMGFPDLFYWQLVIIITFQMFPLLIISFLRCSDFNSEQLTFLILLYN